MSDEPHIIWQGTAGVDPPELLRREHVAPSDFRALHLGQWTHGPEHRIAHETWEAYDRRADLQEIRTWGYPPKFYPWDVPEQPGRVIKSFHKLYDYFVEQGHQRAVDAGWTGTPAQFRHMVRAASLSRP